MSERIKKTEPVRKTTLLTLADIHASSGDVETAVVLSKQAGVPTTYDEQSLRGALSQVEDKEIRAKIQARLDRMIDGVDPFFEIGS